MQTATSLFQINAEKPFQHLATCSSKPAGPLAATFPLTIRQTNLIGEKDGGGEGQKLTNHMLQGRTRHRQSLSSDVSDGLRATVAFSVISGRLSERDKGENMRESRWI